MKRDKLSEAIRYSYFNTKYMGYFFDMEDNIYNCYDAAAADKSMIQAYVNKTEKQWLKERTRLTANSLPDIMRDFINTFSFETCGNKIELVFTKDFDLPISVYADMARNGHYELKNISALKGTRINVRNTAFTYYSDKLSIALRFSDGENNYGLAFVAEAAGEIMGAATVRLLAFGDTDEFNWLYDGDASLYIDTLELAEGIR